MPALRRTVFPTLLLLGTAIIVFTASGALWSADQAPAKPPVRALSDGPGLDLNAHPHKTGDAKAGRDVFRFETFGNEGFWTDAMRMPQGMTRQKVTPIDALKAGLVVDAEALIAAEPALAAVMTKELKTSS